MPLQRKKKKKKMPPKKTGMSQVQNVKVVVNAAPTPRRRRRAPAKKKEQLFSFGGGGGAGLSQVVSAPSLTQDVLQQSQELRQTIQSIQAGPRPGNNTILGEPGQPENPLVPDQLPVTRAQLKQVISGVIVHQQRQGEAMTQGFEEYKALAGSQLRALDESIYSLTTSKAEAPPVARSESREPLITPVAPRGRSPTVKGGGMAAEEAPLPTPPSRSQYADVYERHLANKKKKGQERMSNAELALAANMSMAKYEKIIGDEKKKSRK